MEANKKEESQERSVSYMSRFLQHAETCILVTFVLP